MIRLAPAVFFVCVGVSSFVQAQSVPSTEAPSSRPMLFVGYSYLFRNYVHTQLNPVTGGMNGWDAAVSVPRVFPGRLGLVGDFSGHFQTSGYFTPQIFFFAAGPEYSAGLGRSRLYAHGLVGAMAASSDVIAQTSSHNVLVYAAGAGLDHPLSSRLSWRFNFDLFFGGFSSSDTNQISEIVNTNPRVSTGPVIHF